MLALNGSHGEGGGQILRTALALSAWLGEPVRLENIRAGRSKPGLRPQHLTAVQALARITRAEVAGAEIGSRDLTFRPRPPAAGHYFFDVAEKTGSAGSVTLIAQALIPPLLSAGRPSTLILRGGTHVPWSPPAHYLEYVFASALAHLGASVSLTLEGWGWYPRGGGELRLTVTPVKAWTPADWRRPAAAGSFQALSAASRLPEHVARRQAARLKERLGQAFPVATVAAGGRDPGSLVQVWGPRAGFNALGAKGKPAEQVADEAADAYFAWRESGGALDPHLADQLVLYLAQAPGPSIFTTGAITSHLVTNLWVVEQFLGPVFRVTGQEGHPGEIWCQGRG
jgi:RNA 3'-terminal phosphate cyclase (ATP)